MLQRVPVTIEGSRGLGVLYGRINSVFAAAGGAGAEVLWPITVPAQPGTLTMEIMSLKDGLPPTWLQAELVGTTAIRLRPSGVGLPIGRFGADIWLNYDRGAGYAPLRFRQGMNIEVDSAGCWPTALFADDLFIIDAQVREEPIRRYTIYCFGAPEGAWSARVDNGLYRVSEKPAGDATQLVLTMNSSALAGIRTGTRVNTAVTLSSPGLPDRSFSFGEDFRLPEVTQATPARIRAGTAATVELSGASLGVGSNGVIYVGEQAALSVLNGNSGTLIVQLPALAAGSYPVCARNALKVPRACAMLTVDP